MHTTTKSGTTPPDNIPTLSTTAVCERLGFTVQAKFLTEIGITPLLETETESYWKEDDLTKIKQAIRKHLDETPTWTELTEQEQEQRRKIVLTAINEHIKKHPMPDDGDLAVLWILNLFKIATQKASDLQTQNQYCDYNLSHIIASAVCFNGNIETPESIGGLSVLSFARAFHLIKTTENESHYENCHNDPYESDITNTIEKTKRNFEELGIEFTE